MDGNITGVFIIYNTLVDIYFMVGQEDPQIQKENIKHKKIKSLPTL